MTCLDYFYNILSRRDYSARELLTKGRDKGFDSSEVEAAIARLQEIGYQSDIRLTENLIASSKGKYGKFAVKRKCLEKGISAELFEQAWEQQDDPEEMNQLEELKDKVMRKYKIDDFDAIDKKTKAKVLNYLQYRGFNAFKLLEQWKHPD